MSKKMEREYKKIIGGGCHRDGEGRYGGMFLTWVEI
jgi:hypothetical protein